MCGIIGCVGLGEILLSLWTISMKSCRVTAFSSASEGGDFPADEDSGKELKAQLLNEYFQDSVKPSQCYMVGGTGLEPMTSSV